MTDLLEEYINLAKADFGDYITEVEEWNKFTTKIYFNNEVDIHKIVKEIAPNQNIPSKVNDGILVIGNAPTALLEVISMIEEKSIKPALVIGVPVGFVSAAESKEKLSTLDIPFITNLGRKGGSPCAAAIVNALFKLLREKNL